jgi:cold shock CspA family protein
VTAMQATVSRYDAETRSGAVLTDTGIELPFDAAAIAETPVRFLRAGQRVRLETTGSGADLTVTTVRFITIDT